MSKFRDICISTICAVTILTAESLDGARAEEQIPTPTIVIYPGDTILDGMLTDRPASQAGSNMAPVIRQRSQLVGKVARQTLLPGRAIPAASVDNPKLVLNGAEVRIVFAEGALLITTTGIALQDGALGATVKVRNADSGRTVTGTVQSDGSISVRGS